jgi:hypothetical protein
MIREIIQPSTARCTLPMYIGFLLSEPKQGSCCRVAEVIGAKKRPEFTCLSVGFYSQL